MYAMLIDALMTRPPAYSPNRYAFWDDPHISLHMLGAHLDPERDAASRQHGFMKESAAWIAGLRPGGELLDLGCGPGLYAELFCDAGLHVTGLDVSRRSVEYAMRSAEEKGKSIRYIRRNYLALDYEEAFDMVTLIYCDFGVLAPSARARLLGKIFRALRPGGLFLVDGWTHAVYKKFSEGQDTEAARNGFWSPDPYMCVKRRLRYEPNVMLEEYHVVTEEAVRTYYNWNQAFTKESLAKELHGAGFSGVSFYADMCGHAQSDGDDTICALARKSL